MTDSDHSSDNSTPDPAHGPSHPPSLTEISGGADHGTDEWNSPSLPHPPLIWAAFWTVVFSSAQLIAAVVGGGLLVFVYLMEQQIPFNEELFPERLLKLVEENMSGLILLTTLATCSMALIILAVVHRRHARRRCGMRPMAAIHWVLVALFVVPIQIIALEVAGWAALVLPRLGADLTEMIGPMSLGFSFVAVCLLPGLGEELFFRGFISRGLVARYGIVAGTILTSFLFGIAHVEPVQATGVFVLGLFIQFVFLTTRSLYGPILLHVLHNFVAVLLLHFVLADSGTAADSEVTFTPLPVLLAASACTWAFVFLFYQTRTRWFFADGTTWSPGYVTAEMPPVSLQLQAHNAPPKGLTIVVAGACYVTLIVAILATGYWTA